AVASVPDSYVQFSQLNGNPLDMLVNGGYFGPTGNFVQAAFQGNSISANQATSTSRQLHLGFDASAANAAQPGLYELSVIRSLAPLPAENNPSVTNFSLFPDYQNFSLAQVSGGSTAQPSAIDIDQQTGIAAVASIGLNR